MKLALQTTVQWIKNDWHSNPWRLAGETWNCVATLTAAIIFAITAPNVPFLWTYPIWLSGTILMIFCGISRGSMGIVVLSVCMTIIDLSGYIRLLLETFN
jgi:hypothetical protein